METETIEIEPKLKELQELEKLVYNPDVKKTPAIGNKLKIMRIELEENYTRIDFVYNNGKYGWVQIEPCCFIRPVGTDMCLTLVKAQGIPLAPQKRHFQNPNQIMYYTLYFPALPKGVAEIDIIEMESSTPGHNYFNFYGVSMEKVRTGIITVN